MQPNPHYSNHMARQKLSAKTQAPGPACTIPFPRGRTQAIPLGAQRKSGQHSGYSNCSIHTLHTSEIFQQANGGHEEEARATTLCMAWHAQQETTSCATIPTDTGRRGYPSCVCACVVGSTFARVHACLRARARMRRVHVHADSRVGARAQKCMCPHERMRLYMCVGVRGYVHV